VRIKMEVHEESWPERRSWIPSLGLGILGYFLLVEHSEYVLPVFSSLFLAGCLFIHSFMHSGHEHDDYTHAQKEEKKL
jgi:hypothetical protein